MKLDAVCTALLVAMLVVAGPGAAFAAPKACTCKNLESIQQELKNALYLADFMAKLSKTVADAEDKQRELKKKEPNNPLSRRSVRDVSEEVWSKERAKARVPKVPGDTGPEAVGLEDGTCQNAAADLKALADGAACKELGDIALKHEAGHRAKCDKLGKEAYWKRLFSEIAAEEAERYQEQAKAVRAVLKKVIDASTVKVSEETTFSVGISGVETGYRVSIPAYPVVGKSSPAKDDWEMKGSGSQSISVTSFKLPGLTCKPVAGKVTSKTKGTLKLDGLKMSLNETNESQGGSFSAKCSAPGQGEGSGYSIAPPGGTGGGEAFAGKDVKLKSENSTDVAVTPWGKKLVEGGASVSGTWQVKVELTCQ